MTEPATACRACGAALAAGLVYCCATQSAACWARQCEQRGATPAQTVAMAEQAANNGVGVARLVPRGPMSVPAMVREYEAAATSPCPEGAHSYPIGENACRHCRHVTDFGAVHVDLAALDGATSLLRDARAEADALRQQVAELQADNERLRAHIADATNRRGELVARLDAVCGAWSIATLESARDVLAAHDAVRKDGGDGA